MSCLTFGLFRFRDWMWFRARSFRDVLDRSSNLFLRENSWSFLLCWIWRISRFRVWFSSLSLFSWNLSSLCWFSVERAEVSFARSSYLDWD